MGRLDGGSKSIQNAFECKLFHIGPSDFPKFLLLFRINRDEFYFLSTAPSQKYVLLLLPLLYYVFLRLCFHCDAIYLSSVSFFPLDARSFVAKICLISVNFYFFFLACLILPLLLFIQHSSVSLSFDWYIMDFTLLQPSLPANIIILLVFWVLGEESIAAFVAAAPLLFVCSEEE